GIGLYRLSDIPTRQNFFDYRSPFDVKRFPRDRAVRAPIPISRIAWVALFAVQVGVDPSCIRAFDILGDAMGRVPIAVAIVPERDEQGSQSRRRYLGRKGRLEIADGHFKKSVRSCGESDGIIRRAMPLPAIS